MDKDDPEKRIAELERQLADQMNGVSSPTRHHAAGALPAGWYADPGGAAFRRYWDGRKWTSTTDEPTQRPYYVDAAALEGEPESSPGQSYPYPLARYGVDPTASYGRDPVAAKPLSDKRAAIAGVLQLFFGVFGAGRFYIGSMALGGCQLGLTIVGFVLAGAIPGSADTAVTAVGLLLIGVIIWAFIDAILMFARVVTDGQGRKLR